MTVVKCSSTVRYADARGADTYGCGLLSGHEGPHTSPYKGYTWTGSRTPPPAAPSLSSLERSDAAATFEATL